MRTILVITLTICALCGRAQAIDAFKNISASLQKLEKQSSKPDSTDVVLSFTTAHAYEQWYHTVHVTASYPPANTLVCRIKTDALTGLMKDSTIRFADLLRRPKEELTTGSLDISLNAFNLAHFLFPAVNGETIRVSLKEQRFDTTDIDWKGRYFNSGMAATVQSAHASIMATMLGGAGNTSPRATGAAPGALLTSSDFASLLPDADSVYGKYHITVQNHSYGTGIENYYGADAGAYDASMYNQASLVHIFSAGNTGTSVPSAGTYAGIPAASNLTGSFKMAKNIITVGAVDSFNQVMPLSSRGPAYDGRIKPELVAFGVDGTSGASALVSGAAALVQQAYAQLYGRLPSAALTKAVLLNSADDVDNRQPDFQSGYGSLNVGKALCAVASKHFFEGEVAQGQTQRYALVVPENIAALKIMLVWIDPPAAANAAKALVNDLDASLALPATAEQWLPWVLNPGASANALLLPATRKTDTLNPVEQITIDNPQPGNYIFSIEGTTIVSPTQRFAVVYQFDTAKSFTWSYPTARDVLKAGTTQVLRWQSAVNGEGSIAFSIDNGPWQNAVAATAAGAHWAKWPVPDTTGMVRLKFTIPSQNLTVTSDAFAVSAAIKVEVGFNCTDSFLLHWNSFPGGAYQVYQLGEKYLEPVLAVQDSFSILHKQQFRAMQYAVAPKIGNHEGLRSFSVNYTMQGVQCYLQNFYASLQNDHAALLEASLGSIYQVKQLAFEKLDKNTFTSIHTVTGPSATAATFTDAALTKGVNSYRMAITLQNGSVTYSPVESVLYFPNDPVIVYPNPVAQQQPVKFIVKEPGVYSITMYDVTGKLYYKGLLSDVMQQMHTVPLAKGMYCITVSSKEGRSFTQKLVVY